MDPAEVAKQLRAIADELDSNSGRIRWVCTVYYAELGADGVAPGAGVIRVSRNDADPAELARAMKEATRRVGRNVIPVN